LANHDTASWWLALAQGTLNFVVYGLNPNVREEWSKLARSVWVALR
jgi:hypothetical protein